MEEVSSHLHCQPVFGGMLVWETDTKLININLLVKKNALNSLNNIPMPCGYRDSSARA